MDTTESLTLRPTKVVQARDDGKLDKEDKSGGKIEETFRRENQ